MTRALILGVRGQDGAYLAQHLLGLGYELTGTTRELVPDEDQRLQRLGIASRVDLRALDPTDFDALRALLRDVGPDEIYNLTAQSSVVRSVEDPEATIRSNALVPAHLLQAMRDELPRARLFQASSSEIFGEARHAPQAEDHPMRPRNPYGLSKYIAHALVSMFRAEHGLYACCGILYNHESPLRSREFVTRKISSQVAEYARGERSSLTVGNVDARRDWGDAREFVIAMQRMLQLDRPTDLVLATGRTHSVREFLDAAFDAIGSSLRWEGEGLSARALDSRSGELRVEVSERFFRAAETVELVGDTRLATQLLGWSAGADFQRLVAEMVAADLAPGG